MKKFQIVLTLIFAIIFCDACINLQKLTEYRPAEVTLNQVGVSNDHGTVEGIVNLLQGGSDIALITDAGTPGISDPGFLLARECRRHGIAVDTLPGATALIPALVNSGLPCERFTFEGFLPQKKGRHSRLD